MSNKMPKNGLIAHSLHCRLRTFGFVHTTFHIESFYFFSFLFLKGFLKRLVSTEPKLLFPHSKFLFFCGFNVALFPFALLLVDVIGRVGLTKGVNWARSGMFKSCRLRLRCLATSIFCSALDTKVSCKLLLRY